MSGRGAVLVCAALACAATGGAAPARAGAWPRAPGHFFLSTAVTGWRDSRGVEARGELFLEYGLKDGWTLGLESELGASGGGDVFVGAYRMAPWSSGRDKLRWGLALGRRRVPGGGTVTILRPALAWGRGFGAGRLPWPGWEQVELQAELWPATWQIAPKIEVTLGVKPSDRWAAMLQVRADAYPGAPRKLRLVPGLIRRLGRHARLAISPGMTIIGGHDADLKLAVWTEF
ncbi:hypothetical protein [Acidimangrovimonas pyrenivorans]|uniref:Cellulose biosynthesis protein BcsS n=1 Tax=Acidimangrovimonas pyrenivorans TaxID=2030798 RepID=A0ABV7AKA3_9RHOB